MYRPHYPPHNTFKPLTMGVLELRNAKKPPNKPKMGLPSSTSVTPYRCKVCGKHNHLTTLCMLRKKEGCWRCGGSHLLRECTAPFIRSTPALKDKSLENERTQVLAVITCNDDKSTTLSDYGDLSYPVRLHPTSGSHITIIVNLDTGAQCSAIRRDVAEAANIDWRPNNVQTADLRGVGGEKLSVIGITRVRLSTNGHSTSVDA